MSNNQLDLTQSWEEMCTISSHELVHTHSSMLSFSLVKTSAMVTYSNTQYRENILKPANAWDLPPGHPKPYIYS